ncbi:MAG: hypothetical protein RI564_07415 [Gracilimonas sp.]|nr:hypothetical protein [Gracilimonas sp.]
MKRAVYTILLAFFLALNSGSIHGQTSDYQVKQEFETKYNELLSLVQHAKNLSVIDSLNYEIDALRHRYEKKEELLDKALYPESFIGVIDQLNHNVSLTRTRLIIIEDQREKIASLSGQISSYKKEVAYLNDISDSLNLAIRRAEKSEKELTNLVQRYRHSLEKRDELMLNMIDSLFMGYKDVHLNRFTDLPQNGTGNIIQDSENPLQIIQSVIEKHITILKSNTRSLQTEDFLRMYVVQNRFSEVWNQIGDDLLLLYGGEDSRKWRQSIESDLHDWHASASKQMWASLDLYLEQNEIELTAFDNNQSFYDAIDSFVKNATDASQEKVLTNDGYESFQSFFTVWNEKIKKDWGPYVQQGELLTMKQISTIDQDMMNWNEKAQPRPLLIPILFTLSLCVIVILVIVLVRK